MPIASLLVSIGSPQQHGLVERTTHQLQPDGQPTACEPAGDKNCGVAGKRGQGGPEPRVAVTETGLIGDDKAKIVWRHDKTPESFASGAGQDVIIASTREARMISAEASAITNDMATAIGILDDFHTAAGIPPVRSHSGVALLRFG